MTKSLGRLALLIALAGTVAMPSMAFTQTPAPAGGFVDTDGDGLNDAAENPACVGDAGASRGGFIAADGCTGSFQACFAARPDSYYTCGPSGSWDSIALRGVIESLEYVVDGNGRRYMLHGDHTPVWVPAPAGGHSGGTWGACSNNFVLHRGTKAFPAGRRPVDTGLPPQNPPFCHPTVIYVDRTGGGVDKTARATAADAKTVADRLATLIEDPERGFEVVRKTTEELDAEIHDERTGLAVTRDIANRLATLIEDPERGFEVVRKTTEELDAEIHDERTGLAVTRETADSSFIEVFNTDTAIGAGGVTGNGIAGDSRIDKNEARSTATEANVKALMAKGVVIGVGYAYNGFGFVNNDWSRPQLHGPRLELGYRATYNDWVTVAIRAYGSPYNVRADGFTVGGNVAIALRPPKCPLFFGVALGGSGWASGVYAPGSRGYSRVSGGGFDLDGMILWDIPKSPISLSAFVGLRVHGVKAVSDRDPVLGDFAAGTVVLFRL